jgi:hypothetical protein
MGDMADPTDGLWSWCVSGRLAAVDVRSALAGVLQRPVTTLEMPVDDAVLCDVWQVAGDFETLIDCYLAPSDMTESTVASAVAVRLKSDILLPDDTLDPSRYLLARPDGTLRPVHVDEQETDDGPERSNLHACTGDAAACAGRPACAASRWKPTPTPGLSRLPVEADPDAGTTHGGLGTTPA